MRNTLKGEQFARLSVFASLKNKKTKNTKQIKKDKFGENFLDQTVIILKINKKKKEKNKDNSNYYSKCFHQWTVLWKEFVVVNFPIVSCTVSNKQLCVQCVNNSMLITSFAIWRK